MRSGRGDHLFARNHLPIAVGMAVAVYLAWSLLDVHGRPGGTNVVLCCIVVWMGRAANTLASVTAATSMHRIRDFRNQGPIVR